MTLRATSVHGTRLYLHNFMSNLNMSDSKDLRSTISEQVDSEHVTNQVEETTPEVVETQKAEMPSEQPEATAQESFSQKMDTKGLTPEKLEEIYSNYQKAYTQKRQKEKEEIRKYQEELKALKERPQITPQSAATQNTPEQKEVQRQFDLGNLSFEEYTNTMRQLMSEDARRIAREEFEQLSTQREDTSNQEQMLQRFNALDERFDRKFTDTESPEYNKLNHWLYQSVASELANALQIHIDSTGSSRGFNSDSIAKEAIKRFDSQIDSVVASKVKESTQNAQNRAVGISRSTPKGGNAQSTTVGSRNLRDVIGSNMGN